MCPAPLPLVPAAAKVAAQAKLSQPGQKFAFDTPSPDDLALQRLKAGGAKAAAKAAGAAPATTGARPSDDVATELQQKLSLGNSSGAAGRDGSQGNEPAGETSAAGKPGASAAAPGAPVDAMPRRPVSEYRLPAGLAQACASALVAEKKAGAKPRLHLVVLGHVDAGKSTLMGRFLFELGLVNQRTVHKTQVGGRGMDAGGRLGVAWDQMGHLSCVLRERVGIGAALGFRSALAERERRRGSCATEALPRRTPALCSPAGSPHRTPQKEAAAAGKASFAWAWMLDERPEERARGITVDVAMTRSGLPGGWVGLAF